MAQLSKVEKSREIWKDKAVSRGERLREMRKACGYYKGRVEDLWQRNRDLKKEQDDLISERDALERERDIFKDLLEKRDHSPEKDAGFWASIPHVMRIRVCVVLMIVNCNLPFRAVPNVLKVFVDESILDVRRIPHFTSGINWTMLVGLGLLEQVKPIQEQWAAIIDHSIDIGGRKLLVVLRVPLSYLRNRKTALTLKDCECIGIRLASHVTGEMTSQHLKEIFDKAGKPTLIIKDGESMLHSGVKQWIKKYLNADGGNHKVYLVSDLGHRVANALKKEFKGEENYEKFSSLASDASKRLKQTEYSYLIPPKLRSKGRFHSISNLARWAKMILYILSSLENEKNGAREKLSEVLPNIFEFYDFIVYFEKVTFITDRIMELLKNNGLNQDNARECQKLLEEIPESSKVRQELSSWIDDQVEIYGEFNKIFNPDKQTQSEHSERDTTQVTSQEINLLISSDIIESLFGKFKYFMERSPHSDMNRSVLLVPTFCGELNAQKIIQALESVQHVDLKTWEAENIPPSIYKNRKKLLRSNSASNIIQKPAKMALQQG